MRIGMGFDVHRFVAGRKLVLGGVELNSVYGLDGHSDADVVLHAVMDALLGALALGDIGQHFPDTDERYRGADSSELTRRVWGMVCAHGYKLANMDLMVLAEKPRIAPYSEAIRQSIAKLLDASPNQISLKATTMERLGFIGREEGMAAQAVVLLERTEPIV